MRAAIFRGPRDIEVGERPDPVIREPTDAIVRVVLACVCGSDLWYYRGEPRTPSDRSATSSSALWSISALTWRPCHQGTWWWRPFIYSDMTCPHCQHGSTISCKLGGNFGDGTIDGGQGEAVRVPLAGSTLVPRSGQWPLRPDAPVVAHALRRDGDRSPRGGQRGRTAR